MCEGVGVGWGVIVEEGRWIGDGIGIEERENFWLSWWVVL